jgi:hypothetical protein
MCWTWPKALVVKLQIKKNGQGSKVESKLINDIFMVTLHILVGSTYNIKSSNTKKFTHFEFFSKSHIIYLDLKSNPWICN